MCDTILLILRPEIDHKQSMANVQWHCTHKLKWNPFWLDGQLQGRVSLYFINLAMVFVYYRQARYETNKHVFVFRWVEAETNNNFPFEIHFKATMQCRNVFSMYLNVECTKAKVRTNLQFASHVLVYKSRRHGSTLKNTNILYGYVIHSYTLCTLFLCNLQSRNQPKIKQILHCFYFSLVFWILAPLHSALPELHVLCIKIPSFVSKRANWHSGLNRLFIDPWLNCWTWKLLIDSWVT